MATQEVYAPCSCGSGKKYKFCCRDKDRAAADQAKQAPASPPDVVETLPDGSKIVQRGARTYRASGNVDRDALELADAYMRQRGTRRGR